MIRIIGVGIVGAILGSFLTGGSQVGIWAGLIIVLAGANLPLMAGTSALRCPACRKRVKMGAATCHHCGRFVGRNVGREEA